MSDNNNTPSLFQGGAIGMNTGKAKLAQALQQQKESAGQSSLPEGEYYFTFSGKNGKFTYKEKEGNDYVEKHIPTDELFLVSPLHFQHGWMCWKERKVAGRMFASIFDEHPHLADPELHGPFRPNSGDGWAQARQMTMRSMLQPITGHLTLSSESGKRVIGDLQGQMAAQLEVGAPAWPLVYCKPEEFEAQGFKNFKLVFDVQGWLTDKAVGELAQIGDIEKLFDRMNELIWVEGDEIPDGGSEGEVDLTGDAAQEEEASAQEAEVEEVPAEEAKKPQLRRPRIGK